MWRVRDVGRRSLFLMILAFLGCSPEPIQDRDIIGVWRPDVASLKLVSPGEDPKRCHIKLEGDGSVECVIPDYLQDATTPSKGELLAGEGKWKLNGRPGSQRIELRIDQ